MSKSIFAAGIGCLLLADSALARDLVSASNSWVSTLKSVSQALSIAGVLAGGVMFQIPGMFQIGIRTLISGILGLVITFAAPGIVSLANSIFGGF